MARLDDWENIIATEVNGAPLPTMIDAVRESAIEFCQRTRLDTRLTERLPYDLTQGVLTVPDGDSEATPCVVLDVWDEQGRLTPVSKRDLQALYPKGWAIESGPATQWFSPQPGQVRLLPRPVDPVLLTIEAAYQPKRNGWYIADFLYELYAREIGFGAIAALHMHSAAPYADVTRAGAYRQQFERRVAELSHLGTDGHHKPRLRVARSEWH